MEVRITCASALLALALASCAPGMSQLANDDDGGGGTSGGAGGSGASGGGGGGGSAGGTDQTPIAVAGDPGCGLEAAAFCETFDTEHPGGRGGPLNEQRFSFARWGHATWFFQRPGAWSRRPGATFDVQRNLPTWCGEQFEDVTVQEDTRICAGPDLEGTYSNQFNELFDDAGDFALNSMMVRQLFDFSQGGTIVFDVDAKRNSHWDGHGWWIELWITEDPSPIPYHGAPVVESFPRNGVGIQFVPVGYPCAFATGTCNQVGNVFVTRDHQITIDRPGGGMFAVQDGVMNRFEVQVSTNKISVYASDAGTTELKHIHTFKNLNLSFSRGYVHLQHSQYNAFKDARPQYNDGVWASPAQVYRWDNIGFDGPVYPPLRSYDFPDQAIVTTNQYYPQTDLVQYGYDVGTGDVIKMSVQNVDLTDAIRATVNFNMLAQGGQRVRYRFNGADWATHTVQANVGHALMRTISIEVPLEDLKAGANELQIQLLDMDFWGWETAGNFDLTLEIAP